MTGVSKQEESSHGAHGGHGESFARCSRILFRPSDHLNSFGSNQTSPKFGDPIPRRSSSPLARSLARRYAEVRKGLDLKFVGYVADPILQAFIAKGCSNSSDFKSLPLRTSAYLREAEKKKIFLKFHNFRRLMGFRGGKRICPNTRTLMRT